MNFETVISKCPRCGGKLSSTEINRTDSITGRKKRVLSCSKCDWKAEI